MDNGLTLKPAASPAQTSALRPDPASRNAVATELTHAQAVTAAAAIAATLAPDDSRLPAVILDPHSREVIYRIADVRSRRVVRRVPEEAKLRLRAYARPSRDEKDGEKALDTTV